MKILREFAGWYSVIVAGEIAYTIVKSENGSWNLFTKTDTCKGHVDAYTTLKEAKESVKGILEPKEGKE